MGSHKTMKGDTPRSVRRITFVRGRHQWALECTGGDEAQLLRHIARCARKQGYPLDRFDLAVISHELAGPRASGLNPVPDKAD